MKVRLFFLFLISLLFIFASVFAQDKHVTIGSGGGITGAATVFKITPSGKVYKGSGLAEIKYAECAKISKSRAKKIIKSITEHVQNAGTFDHPGNIYYFLTIADGDKPKKITWGDSNHPVKEDTRKLYAEIQSVVSTLKYKPVKS
jgi:hypothetical protein